MVPTTRYSVIFQKFPSRVRVAQKIPSSIRVAGTRWGLLNSREICLQGYLVMCCFHLMMFTHFSCRLATSDHSTNFFSENKVQYGKLFNELNGLVKFNVCWISIAENETCALNWGWYPQVWNIPRYQTLFPKLDAYVPKHTHTCLRTKVLTNRFFSRQRQVLGPSQEEGQWWKQQFDVTKTSQDFKAETRV